MEGQKKETSERGRRARRGKRGRERALGRKRRRERRERERMRADRGGKRTMQSRQQKPCACVVCVCVRRREKKVNERDGARAGERAPPKSAENETRDSSSSSSSCGYVPSFPSRGGGWTTSVSSSCFPVSPRRSIYWMGVGTMGMGPLARSVLGPTPRSGAAASARPSPR
jgi:hypothetical protein